MVYFLDPTTRLLFSVIYFILVLKSCIITTKFLKEPMQKKNNNYFDFKIFCHLNNKITFKTVAKNQKKICICLCAVLFFAQKT